MVCIQSKLKQGFNFASQYIFTIENNLCNLMGNSMQNQQDQRSFKSNDDKSSKKPKIQLDQSELRSRLTPIQYAVTQEKATERYR